MTLQPTNGWTKSLVPGLRGAETETVSGTRRQQQQQQKKKKLLLPISLLTAGLLCVVVGWCNGTLGRLAVDFRFPGSVLRPANLPVTPCTLLYLVMGEGSPRPAWVARATWPNVTVLYLAWTSVNIKRLLAGRNLGRHIHIRFFPDSTWASGRNYLLHQAYDLERDQRWRFEYFVFWDEDVYLSYRPASSPDVVITNNSDHGFRLFNQLLVRDRPMRAGISFNDNPAWSSENHGCVRRCQMDNLVVAYHRTVADLLLPYSSHFDKTNWWMSAFMSNLMAAVLAPEHCTYYRQVLVEQNRQVHGNYPRGKQGDQAFDIALAFVNRCLAGKGYAGFNSSEPVWSVSQRLRPLMGPQPVGSEMNCTRHRRGVDFALKLADRLANWPVTCQ